MKIKTNKDTLMKALHITEGVIDPRTTLPVLANILLETQGQDKVKIAATDLDMGVVSKINVTVEEEGAITIPAKKLNDIIRELPQGDITISAKKNYNVTIECEKSFFKLIGLPKEDFPNLPNIEGIDTITLEQQTLKNMLKKTSFAMSREETRYVLNGALMVIKQGKIRMVATDGRRLAMIENPAATTKEMTKQAIIPIKTISELLRTLKEEGKIKIGISENQAMLEIDDTIITTRLIEGEYPNYEQVIPKEGQDKIRINRDKFLAATKRVSLFVSPDSQSVKIDLFKNKMVVSKSTPDVGEAKEEIEVDYKGNEITVGFNPAYIIDALKNIETEEMTMEITNAEKPGVIRDGTNYVYIVLPMQLV